IAAITTTRLPSTSKYENGSRIPSGSSCLSAAERWVSPWMSTSGGIGADLTLARRDEPEGGRLATEVGGPHRDDLAVHVPIRAVRHVHDRAHAAPPPRPAVAGQTAAAQPVRH